MLYDPNSYANPLPEWTPDLTVPSWSGPPQQSYPYSSAPSNMPMSQQMYNSYINQGFDPNNQSYPFPGAETNVNEQYLPQYWDMDSGSFGNGLNQDQQQELMHSLETDGMEDIQSMITQTINAYTPKNLQNASF